MARNITVTFDDGSSHVYQGAPDDVTPEQVQARAEKEFGMSVSHLDGGRKPYEPGVLDKVGDAMNSIRDYMTGSAPKRESVLQGVKTEDPVGANYDAGALTALSNLPRGQKAADAATAKGREVIAAKPELGPQASRSVGDVIGDIGVGALKGAVALPQTAVGIADIYSRGKAGKTLEGLGYKPDEASAILDSLYSTATKQAKMRVQGADGMLDTIKTALENPSAVGASVLESIPSMLGAAGVARGLLKSGVVAAPWLAGAMGEGIVGAGSAAEQIRNENPDRELTALQSLAAMGSGIGDTLFGAAGNKFAHKVGLGDIDTMMASGTLGVKKPGFAKAVIGSGISEGAFEEMPQSAQEQMWQNFAQGKDIMDGVGNAAGMGLVTGAAMGVGGGVLNQLGGTKPEARVTAEDIARSKGFLLGDQAPAAPVAPKVEDQPTTPVVPEVATPKAGLAGILQREGLIDGKTDTSAPAAPAAPTVQPDAVAAPSGATATAAPTVPDAAQPAVNTAQPGAAATVSNPAPAIPATQPMDSGSVQSRLAGEMATLRQRNEEAAAKAEAERMKAEANTAAQTASTGSNYQQKDSTPVKVPGAIPDPVAVSTLVEAGKGAAGKYADVSNTKLYTEPVLYGIINHPNVGPELLDVARTELNRRRGIAPNVNVNSNASITGIPGSTGTRVDTQARPAGVTEQTGTGEVRNTGVGQSGQLGGGQTAAAAPVGSAPTATLPSAPATLKLAPKGSLKAFTRVRQGLAVSRPNLRIALSQEPLTEDQKVASAFIHALGGTFNLVEEDSTNGDMPNAFVDGYNGRNYYFDAKKATHAPIVVAVHEGLHGLPDHIRAPLIKALNAMTPAKAKSEFINRYRYTKLAASDKAEEMGAYLAQLQSERADFWQELRVKMGNKDFSALAAHILGKLKEMLARLSDAQDGTFLARHFNEGEIAKMRGMITDAYTQAMREQGLQADEKLTGGPVAANKPTVESNKTVEDKDEEPDDSRATIEQKDIPESVDAPATLESTLKLAGSKVWNKGRDLKVAMQEAVQAAARAAGVDVGAPSEATTKYLTRVGVKDALSALKQNANAVGWYDLKTRQALAVMSLVHPELARDENARFAMVWAMAVTSNGLKVGKNFEIAEKVYSEYKRTGEMPPGMGIGNAAKAINQSLALFNELKEAWGIDSLRKFMLTNFTVKEITGIQKDLKPGGEHADVVVKGAAILGPKIGNGFFSNLYGNFDALTMDRWLIRTWGRWTGTLISPMEKQTAKAKERLQANLTEILKDPTEVSRLGEAIGKPITADMSVDDLAMAVQKASMEPAIRKVMNATGTGEELRKAGNGLAKYLDGQKEAPAGPTERKYIRKVFGEILSELRKSPEYKDLSMADLQAVLWYAEKRLYESAKEDPSDEEVAGYSDDDAPDYANAASDVARAAGVSDRKIQNALKREEQDGRTGTTRSGDEQAEPDRFGLAPAPGSFADQERRDFVAWQAFKRISANRRLGGSELSWAYEGKSTGDGGRVRVLKKLGVSYVAEWTLGQKAKNVLKANDLFSAKLYELAPGDINNAQKFADAITASKNSAKAGAAVYVYPVQSTEDETGYADMRLFLVENGKSGVAVKRNGDIVSVFGEKGAGMAHSLMQVALAAGGRKLDAFDTILPRLYSLHGFRVVARTKWNDEFAPEGWDKETFKTFNGGEPDVVFMAYDPHHGELYQVDDGKVYDDYDKAVAAQTRAVNKVAKDVPRSGPIFSNKAQDLDQDITLDIPLDNGKTAKLTVNAKTYIDSLNAREDALRMVKECLA